jgi:hypothetical protein
VASPPPVRLVDVERAADVAKLAEWRHWWCGDDHCDCHALEGVGGMKWGDHELGQLLFSSESETVPAIDAAIAIANSFPALCAALRVAVEALKGIERGYDLSHSQFAADILARIQGLVDTEER